MKTTTVTLFVSLIAIALAVMSLFGSHIALSPDAAMAIIAVCTTMIVGISVLDRMTIHNIEQGIHKIEERLDELNEVERRIDAIKTNVNIIHHVDLGLAFFTWKPEITIKEIYRAIEIAMKSNDAKRIHTCVDNLQKLINILNERKVTDDEKKMMMDYKMDIRDTELYPVFKNHLEKVFMSIEELQVK